MANKYLISDELLAAYLDGNTSKEETEKVLQAIRTDKELQEVLHIAIQTNDDLSPIPLSFSMQEDTIPMLQKAAMSGENICAILCEIFILQRHHIPYDEDVLVQTARRKGWLKPEGTPLYCIGNLLAYSGMLISRKYDSTIEDLLHAIDKENDIIVGVDREKLYVEPVDLEDSTNHAVIVSGLKGDTVTIFDPYKTPQQTKVLLTDFMNAWRESHHYMVQVLQSVNEYEPHPIDVDEVPLDGDLVALQEAIAENAHNVWAQARIRQGWTYGKEWDDTKKHDPCLVPFTSLPDSERDYDRLTAFNTIKLVKKLGFDIVKRK